MAERGKRTRRRPRGPARIQGHSITDHALGALADHVHAAGEDHDHDHDGMDLLPAGTADDAVLTSIGIDVGSSGTQVAIARLTLERAERVGGSKVPADDNADIARLTPRRRETLYQSPIYLTPFADGDLIDERELGRFIDHAFAAAGLTADDIDCGVVILTGAARERDNAAAITRRLAETCGDIVSASAGHHLEARLAAHGAGAVARSAEFGQRYLNVDIGGATTKLAVCAAGRIEATAALAIGGRLVATSRDDRIVRVEPAGQRQAAALGFDWRMGEAAPWPQRQAVGERMAGQLVAALDGIAAREEGAAGADLASLWLTPPLRDLEDIDGVIVSGGVGEYVYGRETRSFGDLGLPLGRSLARRIDAGALRWPLLPAVECIRATVLGASSCSVQLSGRTGCITNPAGLLPRRNLPVVQPDILLGPTIDAGEVAGRIRAHIEAIDGGGSELVLALRWQGPPEHARLRALAEGVKRGLDSRLAAGEALYMIVDADIAGSIGALLRDELSVTNDLLILDGIELADLDYVDLGRIRLPSGTVPVTIKTLVFRDEPDERPRKPVRARRPARRRGT